MKCKNCPAFGRDHISKLCVLSHNISRGYCNRKSESITKELFDFLRTDKRAIDGYYKLLNWGGEE